MGLTLLANWDLGPGESEVLNWAYKHPEYEAVLDDRAARNCVSALSIKVRGTKGIILLAKQEKEISLVFSLLRQLEEAGLRIESSLLPTAKSWAGEE